MGLWTLLLFPLVVVLGMFAENSHQRNLRTEQMVAARAQAIAQYEAALIAQRLNNQFVDLQFSGLALIGHDAAPSHPVPNVVRSLRTFIRLHPHLYAIDILSADGGRILWSTQPQASHPITNGSAFTPIAGQPDFFLGQNRFAARVAQTGASGHVLTMQVRIADAQGNTRYFVESPYRLEELLANPALRNTPWSLQIIDTRDHSLLGTVDALGVRFPTRTASVHPGRSVRVAVHGVPPLQVEASWTPQAAQAIGMPARTPWGLLFVLIASMLVAAWAIDMLLRRSERQVSRLSEQSRELEQSRAQLEHVAAFQAMIADVNQAIAQAQDEPVLLQQVCDIAIERGQMALALIARPDVQGRFQFLAAAGQVAYLDGLVISIRQDVPEGNGPAGTAFRQNLAIFNTDYSSEALAPWRQAANALGLQASAALPIVRDGQVWGILSVYKRGEAVFDSSLQTLLRELALDIGRGLERVEHLRQLLSLRAAMDSAADGVLISDVDAHAIYVNPAFTQITGYSPDEIIGRNCNLLQCPGTDAQTVAAIARAVQLGESFSGQILNIRKDGATFWNFLRIAPVRDAHGRLKAFIGFQRDITTNVEQAEHLNRLKRLYQALSVEGDVLLQARSAQEMMDRTCDQLTADGTFHAMWIASLNEQGMLVALAQAGQGADLVKQLRIAPDHPTSPTATAWRTGAVQVYQDNLPTPAGPSWAQGIARAGWASALAAPVLRGGAPHAVLVFVADRMNAFDAETVQACARLATMLGHALDELDVKDQLRQLQQQESLAARTDTLTQLPNRFALEQYLPYAMERARRHGTALAIGMIDLDDFKPVNDQFGHAAGDVLLQQLAHRLQAQLRGTDYLARLGGDEFVLVFEDLDTENVEKQLAAVLKRPWHVIQEVFDLGQERKAQVGMTLGLAIFPGDGEDADTLLRNADAAMYQAKARKGTRTQWWRLWREGTLAAAQVEAPFDPFDDEVRQLLRTLAPIVQSIAPDFATEFYAQISHDPQQAAILNALSPQEFAHLQQQQAQHLQFLLHPDTTAEQIKERAQRLGQAHALVGLSIAALLQATSLYESLLRSQLERSALMAQTRYRLLRIIQARLQCDLQGEITAQQDLLSTYHALLAHPLPLHGRWSDLAQGELDRLAVLPGIRAAFIFRVNETGQLRIEFAAGPVAAQIQTELNAQGLHPTIHAGPDGRRGPMGQAWASGVPQVVESYLLDTRLQTWHALAQLLGVRSATAIPLQRGTAVDAVLFILGAYPHQFSNTLLQVWLHAKQERWTQLLAASDTARNPFDALHGAQWRSLLYQGGVRMVVQPIVDLHSATVTKVEALARLQANTGELLSPAVFMPALGQADLRVLFRQALEQSLPFVRDWRKAGMEINLSLNLDPTTLLDPDCPTWVERSLRDADLPPAALTLELLETQEFDPRVVDEAISRLRALGVCLSMDDLGSGYSSMKRLTNMRFDIIKIDQDVIKDVVHHPLQGIALMHTVLQLGQDMDCAVVAEGLENASLIEVAQLLGCSLGQGYGLARPMPIAALPGWLRAHLPLHLPDRRELHSWLGATAYVWSRERDIVGRLDPVKLDACPLTRFLQRQRMQDADALRWHALWHESASEQERAHARQALLQWLQQVALAHTPATSEE